MTLEDLIAARHGDLIQSSPLSTRAVLHALAEVESSSGEVRLASRHERAYCYGSALYKGPNGLDLREQSYRWGCLAHSSFGTWQIMFIGAFEMGFRGDPVELRDDEVSLPWVLRFIDRRILSKYPKVSARAFADAYNSGNPNDEIVPTEYCEKFEAAYQRWWAKFYGPEVLRA